jgi:PAS domain S-box-containing protein
MHTRREVGSPSASSNAFSTATSVDLPLACEPQIPTCSRPALERAAAAMRRAIGTCTSATSRANRGGSRSRCMNSASQGSDGVMPRIIARRRAASRVWEAGHGSARRIAHNRSMTTGAQEPGIPPDEGARLMALARLSLLGTPPDEAFDRVTRLAAHALAAPIALISLVDQTRQWFKSSIGLRLQQTPRETSFCAHAIYARAPLVVPDALRDPRFADNPLVAGAPHVRAYAGIPLYTTDLQPVGTLCVMDTRPREFDAGAMAALADLAAVAQASIHALELAKQNESALLFAQAQEQLFRVSFEQVGVGMVHVSLAGLILRANRRACELLGFERDALQARSVIELTHPDDLARAALPFRRMAAGEIADYQISKRILTGSGEYLPARLTVVLRRTESGLPDHLLATVEADAAAAWDTMARDLEVKTQQLAEQNDTARRTIRELIEAEAGQREAERRYRTVADGVPALLSYWNRALRCEFANAMYREWFGLEAGSVLGRHMSELMDPSLYAIAEPHARAALDGEPQQFERRIVNGDGTCTFHEARYVPDRDESGTVTGSSASSPT